MDYTMIAEPGRLAVSGPLQPEPDPGRVIGYAEAERRLISTSMVLGWRIVEHVRGQCEDEHVLDWLNRFYTAMSWMAGAPDTPADRPAEVAALYSLAMEIVNSKPPVELGPYGHRLSTLAIAARSATSSP